MTRPLPTAAARRPRPAGGAGRAVALRPAVLGLFGLGYALAVAWTCYDRLPQSAPAAGDGHAWWHGAPQAAAHGGNTSGGVGPFLALLAPAIYLLLPLLFLLALALRRAAAGGGRAAGAAFTVPAFVALGAAAGAAVTVPVGELAARLGPDGAAAGSAPAGDVLDALRLCAAGGLLLAITVGVPWTHAPPRPHPKESLHDAESP